jgi:hypothetical protein
MRTDGQTEYSQLIVAFTILPMSLLKSEKKNELITFLNLTEDESGE